MALSSRIVGGAAVDISMYPYQVSIQELEDHICGGSIVNELWILTAAHCLDDTIPKYVKVRVGSSFINHDGFVHNVQSFAVHPEHIPYSWIMDFALIELETPIQFSALIQPIALASRSEDLTYEENCVVAGWGRTLDDLESYEQLRAVEIPLVSDELCSAAYGEKIDSSMICAGDFENGGKGSCAYDSGGPLVCGDVQVGIVSWGKGCALPGFPDVYSNVLYAKPWINSILYESHYRQARPLHKHREITHISRF
ncbi:trypsin 3A1-like isoform X2 [Anopheles albimanus]|uniref:trypsin 3A1-like isoform X2 n=1 Tax=Anopheles albimanus TaxID=7167 RepID=UPI0016416BDD|nr:trypsin 3A1-like isoform X2 [Anopheles albimanus]